MTYVFAFLDNKMIVLDAANCKHYSGHAALTDVKAYNGDPVNFKRFNVGLYGLRYMYQVEEFDDLKIPSL